MRRISVSLAVVCVVMLSAATAWAEENSWEFSGVDEIRLDGVSGDLVVQPASGDKIVLELVADVRPADSFRGEVEQSGSTVRIDEDWSGGNSSGRVKWTLHLPKGSDVVFVKMSTASGDLDCSGVAVRFDFSSASGDVELSSVELADDSEFSTASGDVILTDMSVKSDTKFSTASGDVELDDLEIDEDCSFSTASGDVEIKNCTAGDDVEFSSASGDVIVKDIELKGESSFSSASGDVSVSFAKLPGHDLVASSASGDVDLSVGDFGDDFKLVLIKRKDKGRISCPFKYTEEDEFEDHHVYEVKIVEKGSGKPQIKLRTASGKVTVKD